LTEYKEADMMVVIVLTALLRREDNEDVETMDLRTVEAVVLIRALFRRPEPFQDATVRHETL
jgi:hypothetical protein